MLTRCPHCATAFRVGPEQLKMRQGRVRCGACHEVFNALDELIEMNTSGPSSDSETVQDSKEFASAPQVAEAPASLRGHIPAETLHDSDSATQSPPATAQQLTPLSQPVVERLDETSLATATETAATSAEARTTDGGPGVVEAKNSNPDATHWAAAIQTTDPPSPRGPVAVTPLRARRYGLALVCLLAFGVLMVQAAHYWRVELATRLPATLPWLDSSCRLLECKIELPTDSERLGIESSDLNPEPGDATRLRLVATLRNRAPYAQGWPHLELTLTDPSDQALARRVIAPDEYLAHVPTTRHSDGFSAQSELTLTLPLATRHANAAGYRLYLFYP